MMQNSSLPPLVLQSTDKVKVFSEVEAYLKQLKLAVVSHDASRPWGGFFVISEDQAEAFTALFFPNNKVSDLYLSNKLSPKFLLVEPGKRLSWQYHFRRAEIWRVVSGKVGVVTSKDDQEGEAREYQAGDIIRLAQGERHRLVGRTGWGIVAEIWQHTDAARPSDESDIVRLQDDFGR